MLVASCVRIVGRDGSDFPVSAFNILHCGYSVIFLNLIFSIFFMSQPRFRLDYVKWLLYSCQ